MPFVAGLPWRNTFSKVLLNGPPLSFKTTSLLTFPRPLHVIGIPGEQGLSTIRHDPAGGVYVYGWEETVLADGTSTSTSPTVIWQELQAITREVLTGKRGPVHTVACDGIHKLYDLLRGVRGWSPELEDRGKTSGAMHHDFRTYLSLVLGSTVPQKVMTCFDGVEQDEVEKGQKAPKLIYPGLYGYMAKDVMGYFPVTIHAKRVGVGPQQHGVWELQAVGNTHGAGLHVPPALLRRFPAELEVTLDRATGDVKGGWHTVEKVLAAIEQEDTAAQIATTGQDVAAKGTS